MAHIAETRRASNRERASDVSLGRDNSEDTAPLLTLQAAFLASRYALSGSLARTIAEAAFASGKLR